MTGRDAVDTGFMSLWVEGRNRRHGNVDWIVATTGGQNLGFRYAVLRTSRTPHSEYRVGWTTDRRRATGGTYDMAVMVMTLLQERSS